MSKIYFFSSLSYLMNRGYYQNTTKKSCLNHTLFGKTFLNNFTIRSPCGVHDGIGFGLFIGKFGSSLSRRFLLFVEEQRYRT